MVVKFYVCPEAWEETAWREPDESRKASLGASEWNIRFSDELVAMPSILGSSAFSFIQYLDFTSNTEPRGLE